ncbi:MAG: hypothetical protein HY606_12415 [Planctomycetes bacterium]|nr:hypothetical protein [Planctomycetota bacterium]
MFLITAFQEEKPKDLSLYIVLSISISLFILYMFLRNRRAKREQSDINIGVEENSKHIYSYGKIRDELSTLYVQIQEAVNEYVARLDTKIKLAQALLGELDKTRDEVKKLLSQLNESRPKVPQQQKEDTMNPLHKKVFDLRNLNKSIYEISKEVSLTEGEVELILGLKDLK